MFAYWFIAHSIRICNITWIYANSIFCPQKASIGNPFYCYSNQYIDQFRDGFKKANADFSFRCSVKTTFLNVADVTKIVLKINCGDSNLRVLAEQPPFLENICSLPFSLNILLVFETDKRGRFSDKVVVVLTKLTLFVQSCRCPCKVNVVRKKSTLFVQSVNIVRTKLSLSLQSCRCSYKVDVVCTKFCTKKEES